MSHPHSSILAEAKGTILLAIPLIAGQLSQMLIGVTDTVMIAQIGILPLAAATFVNAIIHIPFVFGLGVLASVSIRVSQSRGADDAAGARNAVRNGAYLGFGMGFLMLLGVMGLMPAFHHLGQDAGVVHEAEDYLVIIMASLIPALGTFALKNAVDALNRPWGPFWIMLGGVFANIVLNYVLIFGHFGAPRLELEGAGWATLIARSLTFLAMFGWCTRWGRFGDWMPLRWLRWPDWSAMKWLLRVGWPTGLQLLTEVGAFGGAAILIGTLGQASLAAHQVAITCAAMAFMVPLGLAMALTVRVGEAWGAEEWHRLRPIMTGGLLISAGVMSLSAVSFALGGRMVADWFVDEAAVITLGAQLLLIAAVFQISDGIQVVAMGCLRGINDVAIPAWIVFGCYWLLALPVGSVLAFGMDIGAVGIWSGLSLGLFIAAIALTLRLYRLTSTTALNLQRLIPPVPTP